MIDPSDLFAVFETKQVDQCSMAEDAGPSVGASESLGTSATAETAETELKGLLDAVMCMALTNARPSRTPLSFRRLRPAG